MEKSDRLTQTHTPSANRVEASATHTLHARPTRHDNKGPKDYPCTPPTTSHHPHYHSWVGGWLNNSWPQAPLTAASALHSTVSSLMASRSDCTMSAVRAGTLPASRIHWANSRARGPAVPVVRVADAGKSGQAHRHKREGRETPYTHGRGSHQGHTRAKTAPVVESTMDSVRGRGVKREHRVRYAKQTLDAATHPPAEGAFRMETCKVAEVN